MSFKAFLKSKIFLQNVVYAVAVTLILLLVMVFVTKIYTHHGESLVVPDLSGLGLDEVSRVLESSDLEYQISDSVYNNAIRPGAIVDQVPAAGEKVKEGRTIFLTICALNPEQVAMPRLTDISMRQAVNILQSNGLMVGQIEYVPSEFPTLVLSQSLNGREITVGTMVSKGTSIDLTVGKSTSGELTVVPDLTGVTFQQAKSEITSLYLTIGAVIYDESVVSLGDSLNARVWMQRPDSSYGEGTEQGTSVDLWLTVDDGKLILNSEDAVEEVEQPETENEFF